MTDSLNCLLKEVRACHICRDLPLGPKPILQVGSSKVRLLITGQAPGTRAHETGITFNDSSGDRLREWMGINRSLFYNDQLISIIPMGFQAVMKGVGIYLLVKNVRHNGEPNF